MGNLDFTNQVGFSWYCVLLMFSGIAMLVMALVRGPTRGVKIANLIFGAGFLIYGLYLTFLFQGGTYFIFFKAFILPALLIVNTIRSAVRGRARGQAGSVTMSGQYQPPGEYPPPPSQRNTPGKLL